MSGLLKYIGKPEHIIAVTGTNGKTTVANMLNDVLTAEGKTVLSNRAGSNIISGVSTALLKGCGLLGRVRPEYDLAILEIDERSAPRIYPYVKPEHIVITNLFRDSIMRNAHPGYIADILTRSLPKESRLILNADDLISCTVAPENQRVYFGIDRLPTDVTECENLLNDMRICPDAPGSCGMNTAATTTSAGPCARAAASTPPTATIWPQRWTPPPTPCAYGRRGRNTRTPSSPTACTTSTTR